MRLATLFATLAIVWAVSIGVAWADVAPAQAPTVGELSFCIVPMAPTVWPIGSCSDRPDAVSGGNGGLTSE